MEMMSIFSLSKGILVAIKMTIVTFLIRVVVGDCLAKN